MDQKFRDEVINKLTVEKADAMELRDLLIEFRNSGMDKNSMQENLNKVRFLCSEDTEDVVLELMDFVTGFCNPDLKIYK